MRQTITMKKTAVKSPAPPNRFEAPLAQKASTKEDLSQKVAQKAYELYVERGCAHGYDVEDWVKAERIVKGS